MSCVANCVAIQQALKRKKGQISSDSDSEQQAGLHNFERLTVLQKISRTIGVSIFSTSSNLQAFQTGGKSCAEPLRLLPRPRPRQLPRRKQRRRRLWGVSNLFEKGAYMGGTPQEMSTKMRMYDHNFADLGLLNVQTHVCILNYFDIF